jgi:hypothetical protein
MPGRDTSNLTAIVCNVGWFATLIGLAEIFSHFDSGASRVFVALSFFLYFAMCAYFGARSAYLRWLEHREAVAEDVRPPPSSTGTSESGL